MFYKKNVYTQIEKSNTFLIVSHYIISPLCRSDLKTDHFDLSHLNASIPSQPYSAPLPHESCDIIYLYRSPTPRGHISQTNEPALLLYHIPTANALLGSIQFICKVFLYRRVFKSIILVM